MQPASGKVGAEPTLSDYSLCSFCPSVLYPCPSPNPVLSGGKDLQAHRLDCGADVGDFAPSLQEAFFPLSHPNKLFPNKCPMTFLPKVVLQTLSSLSLPSANQLHTKALLKDPGIQRWQWFSHLGEESTEQFHQKCPFRDFPGGPVVKNLPSNAGDAGLIPRWGTKTPHATGQLSPRTATTEPTRPGARAPQQKILHASTKIPCATTKTQRSQLIK